MMQSDQIELIDTREVKRQGHRVHMTSLVIIDMLVEAGMLGLFAYAGTIPVWIAVAFLMAGTGTALAFFMVIKLGLNAGFRDKGLLVPQILANGLLQLIFLLLAPNLAILFLLALLLTSGYAVVQFTPRQFTIAWIIFAVTTGVAVLMVRDRFGYPGVSNLEIGLVWLFFVLALRLLTLASAQFGRLREQLSEKNRQLEASLLKIETMASHDHLTGVYSRRNFMQMLEAELQRADRAHRAATRSSLLPRPCG